jgi:glycosyltransferase involved in cell wall biosynthesis
MNVALVSQPPTETSGTGNYAAALAGALDEHADLDRVFVPVDARSPVPFLRVPFDRRVADAAVVHVQFDYVLFGPRGAYVLLLFPLLFLVARRHGTRLVVTLHEALTGDHVAPPLAPLKRAYLRALNMTVAACADQLVFLSEQGRDRFTDGVDARATTVVPHGVDRDASLDVDAADAKREFGYDPGDVVVVEPGYVDPRKGTDVFVDLARRRPDWEFLVAGGPARERHRAFAESLRADAPDNVTLTGRLPEERFHRAFVAADAAVLPYREAAQTGVVNPVTQSGVFNQCAAHRLPVAATDCRRFRAVNEAWGCPLLFDVDELEDVAARLDRLLADEERERLRAALGAYAEANDFERVAEAHLDIYREVT